MGKLGGKANAERLAKRAQDRWDEEFLEGMNEERHAQGEEGDLDLQQLRAGRMNRKQRRAQAREQKRIIVKAMPGLVAYFKREQRRQEAKAAEEAAKPKRKPRSDAGKKRK